MNSSCLIGNVKIPYMKEILVVIFALLIPNWAVARIDLDGNGLSDVWEKIYGGDMSANNDDDYDGRSNLEEEIAGTNPKDANSFFRVNSIDVSAGNIVDLIWPTVPGKRYQIQLSQDLTVWLNAGGSMVADGQELERSLAFSEYLVGEVNLSKYLNIDPGDLNTVKNLVSNNAAADEMTVLSELQVVQSEPDVDQFGQWIWGWLIPPQTGNYTFWVAADDLCEFWLSADESPQNTSLTASVNGWTSFHEWDKYPSQQSGVIALQGGQPYYFEVYHREYGGGDHLSIAWTGPTLDPVREVIAGQYLTAYAQTLGELGDTSLMFRVVVDDADSDDDNVNDAEERWLQLNPNDATTSPQVADLGVAQSVLDSSNTVIVGAPEPRAYEATAGKAVFSIVRAGSVEPLTVNLTYSGTASSSDYEPLPLFVEIPGGVNEVNVEVTPISDGELESAETLTMHLQSGENYQLGNPASATVSIDDAEDVFYVATLRSYDYAGIRSGGQGYGTLRMAGNEVFSMLGAALSNLTSLQTGAEIFISNDGGQTGTVVLNLPMGQVTEHLWNFDPAGGYSTAAIIQALKDGDLYLRITSENHTSGEIVGQFVAAAGWQNEVIPPSPPVAVAFPSTQAEAARFLTQATYGPDQVSIDALMSMTFSEWIDAQLALPATLHLPYVQARRQELLSESGGLDDGWQSPRQEAWWQHSIDASDQLRQRVAFALSQIFVISDFGALDGSHEGVTDYYDMLLQHAFGNYRDLLEAVTKSPMMGVYLSMIRNQKPDPETGQQPDENYAREVMQLFSIGLSQLFADGSLILDENGFPIPTYTQDDIVGLAHVFTGWGPYYDPANPPADLNSFYRWGEIDPLQPMVFYPEFYDEGAKNIVDGNIIPAQGDGVADMDAALDVLYNHPNVGPFMALRLIQRLVTSNPSPGYIYRVAQVFNDNGSGVRGDLGAVVKAILLDPEARNSEYLADNTYGKQREPLLRISHFYRAFDPIPPLFSDNGDERYFLNLQYSLTHQAALKSPSVFNFYQPGHIQPGQIADAGLYAPEFQITSETTTVVQTNQHFIGLFWGMWTSEQNSQGEDVNVRVDLTEEVSILNTAGFSAEDNQGALLDHLNLLLLNGAMSPGLRAEILEAYVELPGWFDYSDERQKTRVEMAIYLIMASPEYAIQR